jgi:hypothetical protein
LSAEGIERIQLMYKSVLVQQVDGTIYPKQIRKGIRTILQERKKSLILKVNFLRYFRQCLK